MSDANKIKWQWWHSGALFVLPAALIVIMVAGFKYDITGTPVKTWGALIVMFVMFSMIVGHGVTGSWKGAFIDNRNVISLSRFQMLAWTVLVLSAFMAAALWNILHAATPTPLDITLPETLWLLMGISTTSLVASPLILNGKKNKQPDVDEKQKTLDLLSKQGNILADNQGQVMINTSIEQASWVDMFTGEETGNAAHLDLTRVQMFFFTIVSLLCYGVAIGHLLAATGNAQAITDFPGLSEGLIALISISHVGYLVAKAIPHSQTDSDSAAI